MQRGEEGRLLRVKACISWETLSGKAKLTQNLPQETNEDQPFKIAFYSQQGGVPGTHDLMSSAKRGGVYWDKVSLIPSKFFLVLKFFCWGLGENTVQISFPTPQLCSFMLFTYPFVHPGFSLLFPQEG